MHPSPPTHRRPRFGRRLLFILTAAILGLFLLLHSPAFLKAVVLPRMGDALGADLRVGDLAFSPFSRLRLQDLRADARDGSYEAEIGSLDIRYDLLGSLRGGWRLQEARLEDARVVLRPPQQVRRGHAGEPVAPKTKSGKALPLLDFGPIRVKNLDLRVCLPDQEIHLGSFSLEIPHFQTGQETLLQATSEADFVQTHADAAGRLRAQLQLQATGKIAQDQGALSLSATLDATGLRPEGVFSPAEEVDSLRFELQLQEGAIQAARITFRGESNLPLGSAQAEGRLDPLATDHTLRILLDDIGPPALNLLAATTGFRFDTARLTADLQLETHSNLAGISLKGEIRGDDLQLARGGNTTPSFSLRLRPDLALDLPQSTADLGALALELRQNDRPLLSVGLDQPTRLSWKGGLPHSESLKLSLHLQDLELAEWSRVVDLPLQGGRINLVADMRTRDTGAETLLTLRGRVARLSAPALFPPGSTPLSGNLEASLRLVRPQDAPPSLTGSLSLQELNGRLTQLDLASGSLQAAAEVLFPPGSIEARNLSLRLTPSDRCALDLAASGAATLSPLQGNLSLELRELDLSRLRLLSPSPPPLASGNLQGTLQFRVSPESLLNAQGDLRLLGLRLPDRPPAPSPLSLSFLVDNASIHQQPIALSAFSLQLAWPPSPPHGNRLEFQANHLVLDPQALSGDLVLHSQGLQLDPWLAAMPAAPSTAPSSPSPSPKPPPSEPAPLPLPFGRIRIDARLDALQSRGTRIESFSLRGEALRDTLHVEKLAFTLDGAPVQAKGKLDTSLRGFGYTLEASVAPLALQPLVDAWFPPLRGHLSGLFSAALSLRGRGITGPSLRKNLDGVVQADIVDGRIVLLKDDELRNAGFLSFKKVLGGVLGALARALALPPEEFLRPPLRELRLHTSLRDGRMELHRFLAANPEVHVESHGEILLADDLAASVIRPMPVLVGVSTNIAQRARIYRADRVQEGRIFLPALVRVEGTLGQPRIDWDKSVITGLILQGVAEHAPIRNERAQQLLEGLGGLLSGEGTAAPSPRPTPPDTPSSPTATPAPGRAEKALELIDLLRKRREEP